MLAAVTSPCRCGGQASEALLPSASLAASTKDDSSEVLSPLQHPLDLHGGPRPTSRRRNAALVQPSREMSPPSTLTYLSDCHGLICSRCMPIRWGARD